MSLSLIYLNGCTEDDTPIDVQTDNSKSYFVRGVAMEILLTTQSIRTTKNIHLTTLLQELAMKELSQSLQILT